MEPYLDQIREYSKSEEVKNRINFDKIKSKKIPICLEFIYKGSFMLNLEDPILYLAKDILIRYLSKCNPKKLLLASLSCLYLADCFLYPDLAPNNSDYVYISGKKFTVKKILQKSWEIAKCLDYYLRYPNPTDRKSVV